MSSGYDAEHQAFTFALTSALKRSAREGMAKQPEHCWRVDFETNIFFGDTGKSDFVTPDFLAYRCLDAPYQDIHAKDVLLVGEVLSPSNTQTDMYAKQARYARAGIPMYWEVTLERERSAIEMVRAFALETTHGELLPPGVHPLRQANYLVTGEWSPKNSDAITTDFPFPIHIPGRNWSSDRASRAHPGVRLLNPSAAINAGLAHTDIHVSHMMAPKRALSAMRHSRGPGGGVVTAPRNSRQSCRLGREVWTSARSSRSARLATLTTQARQSGSVAEIRRDGATSLCTNV
ncbi:Uma2 family endonuclease [Nocardia asiatica]|uniref:Uma2 family endonuclease n=1 Tax=Nocardia asiatica TaxID=209252 RepID=UPI00313DC773